jgi:PhnB protein
MTIKEATPYLFFQGDAQAAIALYEKTLGAKVEGLQRFADMPGDVPEDHKDRVMHALLLLGETKIMLSDLPPGQSPSTGCRVEIALHFDDPDQMVQSFQALAASGRVRMDLHDAFWGDKFGSLVDQFGIEWMFSAPLAK